MKFSDFIELHRGYDLPKTKRNADGLVPVIAAGGYDGFHDTAKVQGPGVITGRSGTLGSVYFNTTDFWPLNTTLFVSNFKGNDPLFVYYYLKTMDLGQYATGTTVPTLNRNHLNQIEVNIPDLAQQQEIANKLNLFDKKISTLNDINDNLLDLASTLFEDSFPNARDGENTIGTLMGNFDKQRKPLSKNQRAQRQGEYRYIGATSVVDYVDDFTFDGIYLLLGEDGTVQTYDGKPVLQYVWGPFWPNNHTHVLQGKGVSTEWLYLFWKNQNITSIITGAVQPKISQGNMNSVKVTKPSDDELATFQQKIDPIFNMIRLNTDEIENLKVIRDQLLKELLG